MTDAMTPPTSGMVTDDEAAEAYRRYDTDPFVWRLLAAYERTLGLLERVNDATSTDELVEVMLDVLETLKEAGRDA